MCISYYKKSPTITIDRLLYGINKLLCLFRELDNGSLMPYPRLEIASLAIRIG